jgi:outer membrane protein assembly factor BamD (BamD/ComL family)
VVSDLREEVSLLEEVRAALRRGDAADARAKLDDVRMRFPESKLVQERDALDVRVASASGDHARAVSLARAFVEQYPDSPFRAGVESLVDAPRK